MRLRLWPLVLPLLLAGCQGVEVAMAGDPPGLSVSESMSGLRLVYGAVMTIFGLVLMGASGLPLFSFLRPRSGEKREWGNLLAALAVLGFGGFFMIEVRRQATTIELTFQPARRTVACRQRLLGWMRREWTAPYEKVTLVSLTGKASAHTGLQVVSEGQTFCTLSADAISTEQAATIRSGCARELGSRCR